jgi:hypothetical protein
MKTTSKKIKNGRRPKKNQKKNLFSIPLKFKIRNGRRPKKKSKNLFSIPYKFREKTFPGIGSAL